MGSRDASGSSSELDLVSPKFKKGTTQVSHQVLSYSTPDTQPPAHDAHPPVPPPTKPVSDSIHILIIPIAKTNVR